MPESLLDAAILPRGRPACQPCTAGRNIRGRMQPRHVMDAAPAETTSTAALTRARYASAPALPPGPENETIRTMLEHRSIRGFRPDPLPPGTLEMLVAAAQSAATSSNLQSWSVIAVEEPERKARLSVLAANQAFIRQAPLFLCFLADLSRKERVGSSFDIPMEALPYTESFLVAAVDAALAAQNAVVAAESIGLGTCYVGSLRNLPVEVAEELALPPNCMAVFGLSVGWPDPEALTEIKPRLPQSLVLHRETYAVRDERAEVERYDADLLAFSRRNGMGDVAWVSRLRSRVGAIKGLSGRHQMREWLNRLGFGLK
ncbi:MAG TPA: nitroreductase family protein [Acetobacteraceae bacterium]|nr:nitroreductase family protein [Acetobacteraceae bacterium]